MDDKEVLKKAIIIALDNGWKPEIVKQRSGHIDRENEKSISIANKENEVEMNLLLGGFLHNPLTLMEHSFAKAFWNEDIKLMFVTYNYPDGTKMSMSKNSVFEDEKYPVWKAHLQNMVLHENPIEYIKSFIK